MGKATPHTRQLCQLDFCCHSLVYIENTTFFQGVGRHSGVGLFLWPSSSKRASGQDLPASLPEGGGSRGGQRTGTPPSPEKGPRLRLPPALGVALTHPASRKLGSLPLDHREPQGSPPPAGGRAAFPLPRGRHSFSGNALESPGNPSAHQLYPNKTGRKNPHAWALPLALWISLSWKKALVFFKAHQVI